MSTEGAVNVWNLSHDEREDVWPCHQGPINDLKYADGQLFTAGYDRSIAILDALNGKEINRLTGHSMGVHSASATNAFVASGSADTTVGLWDRADGTHLAWLTGHEDAVTCLAFLSEDRLISGSRDHTLRLWDITIQSQIAILKGHRDWVTKVAAVDEHCAVSIGEDGTLRFWDWQTSEELWNLEASSVAWGLGVDPAGHFAIVSGSDTLNVDLRKRTFQRFAQRPAARGISIHPKGELAALGDDYGDIQMYDLRHNRRITTLEGANSGIMSGWVGPDEQVLGIVNGNVEVISRSTKRTIQSAHSYHVYATRRLDQTRFATGAFDGAVRIWCFDDLRLLAELEHGSLVFSLSFSSNLSCLVSGGGGHVRLWDLSTGQCIWQIEELGGHVMSAIDREGRQVVAADTALYIWRVAEWEKKICPLTGEMVSSVEFMPDGRNVAIGFANGQVVTMNIDNGSYTPLHNEHEDWVRTLRVSADGHTILSVSQNGIGCVYDLTEQRIVSRISDQPIAAADFDEYGQVHWVHCSG
ncbi:PQQ-binding-like beta-propeller repeat protein [Chloroflexi bacterium TSY]|nr:PQQ-binding-like beta-propeller repeat protein [Chloroflexi bacterium TSY]